MSVLADKVGAAFREYFGAEIDLIARAPGRVNLIGEHTDYNDGFVLPAAIGCETMIAARARQDGKVNLLAADFSNAVSSFDLDQPVEHDPNQPWSNYMRGMIVAMQKKGIDLRGADMAIAGNIPKGSGLSSSASLSVATGVAMGSLFAPDALDATQIALLAQQAECDFVGMRCGIMDQLISARGEAGHALLIDCRSLDCRPVAVPPDLAIMIVHSGVVRGLVDGAYNERRAQCEAVAAHMGVAALRDVTLAQLEDARAELDPVAYARARHVVTENDRTVAAAEAMQAGDLETLGQLMSASHDSMRDDFEITVPAIDLLVSELQHAIGPKGGARMTGGGFGGAVVALLENHAVDRVASHIEARYRTPDGGKPLIMVEQASAGASIL